MSQRPRSTSRRSFSARPGPPNPSFKAAHLRVAPLAWGTLHDFDSGDVVYTTGVAEIVWEGKDVRAFAGAERLIRSRVEKVIRLEGSLPLRSGFGDETPMLAHPGSSAETAETIAAERERDVWVPFEIADIRSESPPR